MAVTVKHLLIGPSWHRKANPEVRSHYIDNPIDIQGFVYLTRLVRRVAIGGSGKLQMDIVAAASRPKGR